METNPEQTAEGLVIVRVLSTVLDRLVSANATMAQTDPGQVTKFHAMKAPAISIQQYLERYVLRFDRVTCSHLWISTISSFPIAFTNMHPVRMNALFLH